MQQREAASPDGSDRLEQADPPVLTLVRED